MCVAACVWVCVWRSTSFGSFGGRSGRPASAHPSTRVPEGDGGERAAGDDAADPFASGRVGVEAVVSGETTEAAEAAPTSRRDVEAAVREEMQRRLAEEVAAAHKKAAREAATARRKAQQEVEKVRVRFAQHAHGFSRVQIASRGA